MKTVLFITLNDIKSFDIKSIYTDLAKEFLKKGHQVIFISPTENKIKSQIIQEGNGIIYKYRTIKAAKANVLKKGLSVLMAKYQLKKIMKKIMKDYKVEIVLYATPPITLSKSIKYLKKNHDTFNYLMLKDIFPQNALDLRLMKKTGFSGFVYKYFRKAEKELYRYSDKIGVMSKANNQYILENNKIDEIKLEILPNTIIPTKYKKEEALRNKIFNKYNISINKTILFYGGNLGKPQGPNFIKEIIKLNEKNKNIEIIIIGSGTEKNSLVSYIRENKIKNTKLLNYMKKEEYETLLQYADAGLVFLDHRFTIPNFPSRILSYMNAKLPIIAATDKVTDIRNLIEENDIGYWSNSNSPQDFNEIIKKLDKETLKKQGLNSYNYFINNYTVDKSYKIIINSYKKWKGN